MSEPMKTPRTGSRHEFTVFCPSEVYDQVCEYLLKAGCTIGDDDDLVPERGAPALRLLGARTREGLTQRRLAELTGIPRCNISDMERGRRPIGKKNARKLAEFFRTDPVLFLSV